MVTTSARKVTVRDLIKDAIETSDYKANEIAEKAGFENHVMVSLIKNGRTKVPINKARALATALGLDPNMVMRMVLQERMPELWESLQPMLGNTFQTKNELEIIQIVREESNGIDAKPITDKQRDDFRAAVRGWVKTYIERNT